MSTFDSGLDVIGEAQEFANDTSLSGVGVIVDQHYLELLSNQYPNRVEAFSEIINLQAILNLPKGTEHFVSDLHGEYEAFCHILNSCSGVIHDKVDELFDMSKEERAALCALIYYPREVLRVKRLNGELNEAWYRDALLKMIKLCKYLSAKYTRSKVRKAINQEYSYIIDELLHAQNDETESRAKYHEAIISTILRTRSARHFLMSLISLAKRLAVDHLHVVGDIYDRGPSPDRIMALLMDYHSIDMQWGNHDVLWMGAALGSEICIATVLRNNINYFNCSLLESGYSIPLRKLAEFAQSTYSYPVKERSSGASCSLNGHVDIEKLKCSSSYGQGTESDQEYEQYVQSFQDENRAKMVKAITIIALKLEGQLIQRNPDFQMQERLFLDKMDLKNAKITIGDKTYDLNTTELPTLDPNDPFKLSREEKRVMEHLKEAFLKSKELQREVAFLYNVGSIYKCFNGNLLYHGCIPMTEDGEFRTVEIAGKQMRGKAFLDYCDRLARQAYSRRDQKSLDFMFYLWCGYNSPLSGRVMKPFERYFIDDKTSHKEPRDPYYDHYHNEKTCRMILEEFGLNPETGHIINGHTPVRVTKGESPVRGGGRLLVIDGGLCQAYHKTTGIAGYTLISTSRGLVLKAHGPFESCEKAVHNHVDIISDATLVERYDDRLTVSNTDVGAKITRTIGELEALLDAYKRGLIQERYNVPKKL